MEDFNNHKLRTERHETPNELYFLGCTMHGLRSQFRPAETETENGEDNEIDEGTYGVGWDEDESVGSWSDAPACESETRGHVIVLDHVPDQAEVHLAQLMQLRDQTDEQSQRLHGVDLWRAGLSVMRPFWRR